MNCNGSGIVTGAGGRSELMEKQPTKCLEMIEIVQKNLVHQEQKVIEADKENAKLRIKIEILQQRLQSQDDQFHKQTQEFDEIQKKMARFESEMDNMKQQRDSFNFHGSRDNQSLRLVGGALQNNLVGVRRVFRIVGIRVIACIIRRCERIPRATRK